VIRDKILRIKKEFPIFSETIEILNMNTIDWCIGGSGGLFLLGNDRFPDDIDIYVRDREHDVVDKLFGISSFQYYSSLENVRNSNPRGDHSMQITSHLNISVLNKIYHWQVDDELLAQSRQIDEIRLCPPEDILLIKALLQRGIEVGKHDIDDIKNFAKIYNLDKEYFQKRVTILDAELRVKNIWRYLQ
jgi:hypothetical protein